MNLMKLITENPQLVGQLAQQFGLGQDEAKSAMNPLLGNLAAAFKANSSQSGGLESLLSAINTGGHSKYVDDISTLEREETTTDGNGILGHLFGSKEVSRQVASRASEECGVDQGILKKMLPVLASVAMGMLSKQESSNNLLSGLLSNAGSSSSDGGLGALSSLFDSDGDGSVVDDIAGKLLGNIFK